MRGSVVLNLPLDIPSVSLLRPAEKSAAELVTKYKKYNLSASDDVNVSGSSGDVFILPKRVRGEGHRVHAVKQQLIVDPSSLEDKAYRECRILLQLNVLAMERKCPNFVYLEEYFKSCSPTLFEPPAKSRRISTDGDDEQFMYFAMDYAEKCLYGTTLSVDGFRSALFQLCYALCIAQEEFEFVHHDLHAKNILLQELPPSVSHLVYHDLGVVWYVSGYVAKIADFGLSRLTLRNTATANSNAGSAVASAAARKDVEVIYNVRDSFSELFNPNMDVEKLFQEAYKSMPKGGTEDVVKLKAQFSKLKSESKVKSLRALLREADIFEPLKLRPPLELLQSCSCYSFDGDVRPVEQMARGELEPPLVPPPLPLKEKETQKNVTRAQATERRPKVEYHKWGSKERKEFDSSQFYSDRPNYADMYDLDGNFIQKKKPKKVPSKWVEPRPALEQQEEIWKKTLHEPDRNTRREKDPTISSFREINRLLRKEEEKQKKNKNKKLQQQARTGKREREQTGSSSSPSSSSSLLTRARISGDDDDDDDDNDDDNVHFPLDRSSEQDVDPHVFDVEETRRIDEEDVVFHLEKEMSNNNNNNSNNYTVPFLVEGEDEEEAQ